MNAVQQPPDSIDMLKAMYEVPLYACAQAIGGSCGIEVAVGGATLGIGGEASVLFFVDAEEQVGLFGGLGAGPAVAASALAVERTTALVLVPGTMLTSLDGWGAELEGSFTLGVGVGFEGAFNIDPAGNPAFMLSPQSTTGIGAEAHLYFTYTRALYIGR